MSAYKDKRTGLWLVTFTDVFGNTQQTMHRSLCRAVCMANNNKWITL